MLGEEARELQEPPKEAAESRNASSALCVSLSLLEGPHFISAPLSPPRRSTRPLFKRLHLLANRPQTTLAILYPSQAASQMAPFSVLPMLFPLNRRALATNSTSDLSISISPVSTAGFLSLSHGKVGCPSTTISWTGEEVPLVFEYTAAPFYDGVDAWNGTLPDDYEPVGSFRTSSQTHFDAGQLVEQGQWILFTSERR